MGWSDVLYPQCGLVEDLEAGRVVVGAGPVAVVVVVVVDSAGVMGLLRKGLDSFDCSRSISRGKLR
jgi:hypothetical protein